MRRGIFDPEGGNTERSGSTFSGPDARNNSHLPADAIDGKTEDEESQKSPELSNDPEVIAKRLEEIE